MSLAEELLADLESDEEEELVQDLAGSAPTVDADGDIELQDAEPADGQVAPLGPSVDDLIQKGEEVTTENLMAHFDLKHIDDVKSVSNLMTRLSPILKVSLLFLPGKHKKTKKLNRKLMNTR